MIVFFLLALWVSANGDRNIVRTISDTHLGSYWFQDSKSQMSFWNFLNNMTDPNTNVSKLILLGDFVELWLIPYQQRPKSWSEAMMSTTPIMGINMTQFRETLIAIADNNVPIEILWGNHDLEAPTDQEFSNAFNNHPLITKTANSSYIWMNVVYEHGHYYDIFNRPFPPSSTLSNLLYPFGYYISRAAAQTMYKTQSLVGIQESCWVDKFADWVLDALKDTTNMELLLWALVDVPDPSLITDEDTLLVDGDPTNMTRNATFADVIPMYKNMVNEWIRLQGEDYTREMLETATDANVDYFVKQQPDNILINVMGHTHKAALYRLKRQSGSNIVYANSGAWVDTAKDTWIDIVYNGSTPTTVLVGSYKNGVETWIGSCQVAGGDCKMSAGFSLSWGYWSLVSLVLIVVHITFSC